MCRSPVMLPSAGEHRVDAWGEKHVHDIIIRLVVIPVPAGFISWMQSQDSHTDFPRVQLQLPCNCPSLRPPRSVLLQHLRFLFALRGSTDSRHRHCWFNRVMRTTERCFRYKSDIYMKAVARKSSCDRGYC